MFSQVVFKAKSKYAPELLRYRYMHLQHLICPFNYITNLATVLKTCPLTHRLPLYLLFLFISLVFLVVNLVCALLVRMSSAEAHTLVLVRVAINDTLFVLCAVSLSLCLYKLAKMSLANIYLESKVRHTTQGRDMCEKENIISRLTLNRKQTSDLCKWHYNVLSTANNSTLE